jgi:hypothetical protein
VWGARLTRVQDFQRNELCFNTLTQARIYYKSSLTYADVIPSWYNDAPHSRYDRAPAAEMRRARVVESRAVRSGRALERCLNFGRRDTYNDIMAMLLLKSLQYKLASPVEKPTVKLSERHLYTRYIRDEEVYEDMDWQQITTV